MGIGGTGSLGQILKKQTLSQLSQATQIKQWTEQEENFRYTWWKINRAKLIKNNVFLMKAVLAEKCCRALIVKVSSLIVQPV